MYLQKVPRTSESTSHAGGTEEAKFSEQKRKVEIGMRSCVGGDRRGGAQRHAPSSARLVTSTVQPVGECSSLGGRFSSMSRIFPEESTGFLRRGVLWPRVGRIGKILGLKSVVKCF